MSRKLIRSWGWMGPATDEWKAVWSVECWFFFFFFKRNFTPGQKPLCQGDCLISLLKGCPEWLRFESSFWCWRGQGGSTANHQSLRPRWAAETHVSPTVEPGKLFSPEEQRRGVGVGVGGWGAGRCRWEGERKGTGQTVTVKFTTLVFSQNQRNFLSPSWECSEGRSWLEAKSVLILLHLINI